MFGSIGTLEILVIVAVALMVVGPKRLPQVARTMGKAFGEFKRVTNDVKRTIDSEVDRIEKAEQVQKAKSELMPEDVSTPAPTAKAEEKVVAAAEETLDIKSPSSAKSA